MEDRLSTVSLPAIWEALEVPARCDSRAPSPRVGEASGWKNWRIEHKFKSCMKNSVYSWSKLHWWSKFIDWGDWWQCARWIRVWAGIQTNSRFHHLALSVAWDKLPLIRWKFGHPKYQNTLKRFEKCTFFFVQIISISNKIRISMSSQWHSWGPGPWKLQHVRHCPQLHSYTTRHFPRFGVPAAVMSNNHHLQLSHKFEENMLNLQQWVRISSLHIMFVECETSKNHEHVHLTLQGKLWHCDMTWFLRFLNAHARAMYFAEPASM